MKALSRGFWRHHGSNVQIHHVADVDDAESQPWEPRHFSAQHALGHLRSVAVVRTEHRPKDRCREDGGQRRRPGLALHEVPRGPLRQRLGQTVGSDPGIFRVGPEVFVAYAVRTFQRGPAGLDRRGHHDALNLGATGSSKDAKGAVTRWDDQVVGVARRIDANRGGDMKHIVATRDGRCPTRRRS